MLLQSRWYQYSKNDQGIIVDEDILTSFSFFFLISFLSFNPRTAFRSRIEGTRARKGRIDRVSVSASLNDAKGKKVTYVVAKSLRESILAAHFPCGLQDPPRTWRNGQGFCGLRFLIDTREESRWRKVRRMSRMGIWESAEELDGRCVVCSRKKDELIDFQGGPDGQKENQEPRERRRKKCIIRKSSKENIIVANNATTDVWEMNVDVRAAWRR